MKKEVYGGKSERRVRRSDRLESIKSVVDLACVAAPAVVVVHCLLQGAVFVSLLHDFVVDAAVF